MPPLLATCRCPRSSRAPATPAARTVPPVHDRAGDVNEQLISCPIYGDQNTHIDDVSVRVEGTS
jgi:hypothetical protein